MGWILYHAEDKALLGAVELTSTLNTQLSKL